MLATNLSARVADAIAQNTLGLSEGYILSNLARAIRLPAILVYWHRYNH